MISEPRISPPARPIDCLDAGDDLRDEAFGDRRGGLLGRRPGILQSLLVELELVDRLLDRRIDRVTDAVGLLDHAAHGRDHDDGHQREETEHDEAGCESGLEPAALEIPDQGLEDHGQNRREKQREHDLAHRANAMTTITVARTTPTKLQDQIPSFGTALSGSTPGARAPARHERDQSTNAEHHPNRVIPARLAPRIPTARCTGEIHPIRMTRSERLRHTLP